MVTLPTFEFEQKLWSQGYELVIGVDEVGRGSFAGPVVAGAVSFGCHAELVSASPSRVDEILKPFGLAQGGQVQDDTVRIDDSKRLTPVQRERAAVWIKDNWLNYGVGEVGVDVINKVGIGKATAIAMRKAIKELLNCFIVKIVKEKNNSAIQQYNNNFLLVDAFYISHVKGIPKDRQNPIIRGDQKSISIAAASIIAKVYRDSLMAHMSNQYKAYGWERNKGYGTAEHQKAIKQYGMTPIHRITFVETFLSGTGL